MTIKNLPTKKTLSPDDSTGQSAKYLKEEIIPIRIEIKKEGKDKQMWKNIFNKDDKGLFCYI